MSPSAPDAPSHETPPAAPPPLRFPTALAVEVQRSVRSARFVLEAVAGSRDDACEAAGGWWWGGHAEEFAQRRAVHEARWGAAVDELRELERALGRLLDQATAEATRRARAADDAAVEASRRAAADGGAR